MNQPDTMMTPPVENLMGRTHSKFALVTLSARRAREITSYFKELGLGNSIQVPPLVSSVARKPLSIAFEEIAADKVSAKPVELALPEASLDLPTGEETIADADAE